MTKLNYQSGFTLLEILVVVGIVVIISVPLSQFQKDVFVQNNLVQSGVLAEEGARSVLRQFTSELRSAAPANTGAYLLASAGTSTLTFYSDTNGDGLRERIRYFLAGTSLKKGVIIPTGSPATYVSNNEKISTLTDNVINSTSTDVFSYYNENFNGTGTPLAQPVDISLIRLVKINLGIDPNPNRPLAPIWLTSLVMIRNLKGNL
ncbi:hypothetical protein BK005_00675 [bacterium CG10_37_50]|nr:MAG: hypothetical protein BK005_00675 [bacterium CG10_37_50]